MVDVFIRHKIKDYGTWKQVFDGLPRSVEPVAKWHLGSPPFPASLTICVFSSNGRVSRRQRSFSGPQSWPEKWSGRA
jgi:hypothetical protein